MGIFDRIFRTSNEPTVDVSAPSAIAGLRNKLECLQHELRCATTDLNAAAAAAHRVRSEGEDATRAEASAAEAVMRLVENGADDEEIDAGQRAAERARLKRAVADRKWSEVEAAQAEAFVRVENVKVRKDAAEAELVRKEHEIAASPAAYHAKTAQHVEALAKALAEVRVHANAIDLAFAEATNAAAQARVTPLAEMHRVIPLILAVGGAPSGDALTNICSTTETTADGVLGPKLGGLEIALCTGLFHDGRVREAEVRSRRAELASMLAHRTVAEANDAAYARQRETKVAEEALRKSDEDARREAHEREQRRISRKLDQPAFDQLSSASEGP
jgi:hypothetical protein